MTPEQIERKNINRRTMGLPDLNADGTDPWSADDYASFERGDMPKPREKSVESEIKEPIPNPTPKPDEKPKDQGQLAPEVKEPEMTEEMVRKFLKEKKGIEVDDFEVFKPKPKEETPEEKEKARQIREAKKYTYGVENGYITKEVRDEFIAAQKNPTDLVYAAYKQEALNEDSELSEDEIEAEFRDRFGLNSDPESRSFKRGQKELSTLAKDMMQAKFDKIYALDRDYDAYEAEETSSSNYQQQLATEAPKYKETVNKLATKLKKAKYEIGDQGSSDSFEYEFSDESIQKAVKILLDSKFAESQIARGYSEEGLEKVLTSVLWQQDHTQILSNVAKQYHSSELLKKGAERQGIVPPKDITLQRQADYRNQKATAMQVALGMADESGNLKPEAELQAMVESN